MPVRIEEARNALDPEHRQAVGDAVAGFEADDAELVAVLTGTGDTTSPAGAEVERHIPAHRGRAGPRAAHRRPRPAGRARGAGAGVRRLRARHATAAAREHAAFLRVVRTDDALEGPAASAGMRSSRDRGP